MNRNEFIKEIEKLQIQYNEKILNQLDTYMNYLVEYNTHTNLTAITKEEDIYLKHFYDSLTICKVCDLKNIENLIDIGTGAGFPGLVLKIFFPHLKVTLLDSNNKKTKFLLEVSKKLEIDVDIVNDRVENYAKNNLNKFDLVTSRAVANLRVLSELSIPLVKQKGLFIALKGNIDDNLEDAIDTIEIMNSKVIKKETFDLYNNNGVRNIIVIEKNMETEVSDLRTYDKILKKPLVKKK